jgi:hypothetical protein
MLGGGYFEIEFADKSGRIHALSKQHRLMNQEVLFTTWKANMEIDSSSSDSPRQALSIWAQVVGLPPVWRIQELLTGNRQSDC